MRYRPDGVALALRGVTTRTIGVLVKDFADPFFGRMLAELDRLARRSGFSLVMSGLEKGRNGTGESALLAKYRPDGLLLVGSDFMPDEVHRCAEDDVTVVRLGSSRGKTGIVQVAMDEAAGMSRLAGHLLNLGHARIGYLAEGNVRSRRRETALRKALAEVGAAPPVAAGSRAWLEPEWVRDQARDRSAPTAWVAFDDLTAIRAIHAWHEIGVHVPERFSVTGVDDISAAALVNPALTTLQQPVHDMVREAFRMLLSPMPLANVWIVPELVERASCAPIRREVMTTRNEK